MQRTWVWFLAPTRGFTNIDSSCFRGLCRSTESSYTYTQQDIHTHRIEINKSLQQRVFSWLLLSKANKIIIGYQPFLFISLVHICAHMWLHTEGRSQLPVLFSRAVHLVFWDRVSVVERTLLSQLQGSFHLPPKCSVTNAPLKRRSIGEFSQSHHGAWVLFYLIIYFSLM